MADNVTRDEHNHCIERLHEKLDTMERANALRHVETIDRMAAVKDESAERGADLYRRIGDTERDIAALKQENKSKSTWAGRAVTFVSAIAGGVVGGLGIGKLLAALGVGKVL